MPANLVMPKVDVLMATFNGESFLSEQLDSILSQESVSLRIVISDDGSSDQTLDIVKTYAEKYKNIEIVSGPCMGAARNFFFLLGFSKADFVAFSDQDDIWEPNHLINAVTALRNCADSPAMAFSNVRILSEKKFLFAPAYVNRIPSIENRFFENLARGCTIVLNRNLLEILKLNTPKNAIMHDYWVYLVASCIGRVVLVAEISVNYRLHDSNLVGISRKISLKRFANLTRKSWPLSAQLKELEVFHSHQMTSDIRLELSGILDTLNQTRIRRFLKLSLRRCRYRHSLIDEVFLRVAFFLVKV